MTTRIDHLVVAARTLDEGYEMVRRTLGVEVPPGGRHEMMGTHNRVMALGDAVYLEIIAIDPALAPPHQPRWFALDDPAVRASLAQRPRLLTWAVNCPDLDTLVDNSALGLGVVTEARRDNLRWKVALAEDGRMPAAGFLPLCIQWQVAGHPAAGMADHGCRLAGLTLHHNRPDWLRQVLATIGADTLVRIEALPDDQAGYLSAEIETPSGVVTLDSRTGPAS